MKIGHYVILSFLVIAMFVISGCTNDLEATGAAKGGKGGKGSTECNDKKDNDGDGQCDHKGCTQGKGRNKVTLPADSDCSSADDNSESPDCTPTAEVCDGVDNDCDGSVDEDLTQVCGSDVGECAAGAQTCSGGAWGSCVGEVGPSVEVCDNLDNDCDRDVDEDLTQVCGSDVGECAAGAQTCSGGAWGSCVGEVGPSVEVCDNLDNDCDGDVDNECVQ